MNQALHFFVMQRSRFLELFPTPAYLQMPAVGVDVSDHTIRFLELVPHKQRLVVRRWGSRELPTGTIVNGEVFGRDAVVSALKEIKKETGIRYVHASLPEEKAYLFATEIPRVSKKEVRGAIELLLEENVPIKPQESVFDYEIIKTLHREQYEVSVSVLPESVVTSHLMLFEEAGLIPLVFVVDAQAIAGAAVLSDDIEARFVVHIGSTRTILSIVARGVVYFTSTVAIGADTFTATFERERKLTREQAVEQKKKDGLIGAKQDMELFFSLMSSLSVLRDEMNRLLVYWDNLKRGKPDTPDLASIIFTGSDATLPGLIEYFSLVMNRPVALANVWANVSNGEDEIPPLHFNEALDYATAIGLALPKTD